MNFCLLVKNVFPSLPDITPFHRTHPIPFCHRLLVSILLLRRYRNCFLVFICQALLSPWHLSRIYGRIIQSQFHISLIKNPSIFIPNLLAKIKREVVRDSMHALILSTSQTRDSFPTSHAPDPFVSEWPTQS